MCITVVCVLCIQDHNELYSLLKNQFTNMPVSEPLIKSKENTNITVSKEKRP